MIISNSAYLLRFLCLHSEPGVEIPSSSRPLRLVTVVWLAIIVSQYGEFAGVPVTLGTGGIAGVLAWRQDVVEYVSSSSEIAPVRSRLLSNSGVSAGLIGKAAATSFLSGHDEENSRTDQGTDEHAGKNRHESYKTFAMRSISITQPAEFSPRAEDSVSVPLLPVTSCMSSFRSSRRNLTLQTNYLLRRLHAASSRLCSSKSPRSDDEELSHL
ncbi:hypothetical protein KOW79_018558 [Hemibagrus wyckioides]|uniref:Uncharacterized protein n=1 Tax=Hemibagrus wyckioides TaxID=337641 RepID=A0A9D3SF95_9TELE|nr:hypothetical protein KOW79_018558 [Hemibagrus wyckioides]